MGGKYTKEMHAEYRRKADEQAAREAEERRERTEKESAPWLGSPTEGPPPTSNGSGPSSATRAAGGASWMPTEGSARSNASTARAASRRSVPTRDMFDGPTTTPAATEKNRTRPVM
jgi:hypothetical protein